MNAAPRILEVGEEPPPLIEPQERKPRTEKANQPKKSTGERFKGINAFIDFTMSTLDRGEVAVWLILWRDTKAEGIVSLNGDELKVCYVETSPKDAAKRPAKFESTKENKAFYFVFKRAK